MEHSNDGWNMLPENEARLDIEVGEEIYQLRPDNTEVYTHVGRLALYDCIYHALDDEDAVMYIFREQEGFVELATILVSSGFPVFFNQREVEPYVRRAYERRIIDEVMGGIPDGMDDYDLE